MTKVVGVDGCPNGWCCACLTIKNCKVEEIALDRVSTFQEVLLKYAGAAAIAVDIPIGLPNLEKYPRQCDKEAKALLGKRGSAVFFTPIRAVIEKSNGKSYREVCSIARAATGKKLSKQTYNILNKILEADRCMKQVKQERVFEVHPELCFWAINGKRAMKLSKKKREGFRERFRHLEQILPREAIVEALARFPRSRVGRDDVLDALVAAHTARLYVEGRFQRLPTLPPTDRRRLRMEMIIAF